MLDRRAAALRLVAFLNSLHVPDGDDHLADERAGLWLAEWLGGGPADLTVEGRSQLRELREGLRQLVVTNSGCPPDAALVARAEEPLRATPLVLELGPEPGLSCHDRSDPAGRAVASVAAAYLAARAGEEWSRIKACAGPDCRWAFVDASRNRSRRWCDMAGCGNRAKNRGWRERQAFRP